MIPGFRPPAPPAERPIIEGVIGQLKDLLGLGRHRAKTLSGLPARLAAKVALYTCGQRGTTKSGSHSTITTPGAPSTRRRYGSPRRPSFPC